MIDFMPANAKQQRAARKKLLQLLLQHFLREKTAQEYDKWGKLLRQAQVEVQ